MCSVSNKHPTGACYSTRPQQQTTDSTSSVYSPPPTLSRPLHVCHVCVCLAKLWISRLIVIPPPVSRTHHLDSKNITFACVASSIDPRCTTLSPHSRPLALIVIRPSQNQINGRSSRPMKSGGKCLHLAHPFCLPPSNRRLCCACSCLDTLSPYTN